MSHAESRERRRPKRQRAAKSEAGGMFADPVVRLMAYVALGLVILFLATVVGALWTGMGTPKAPRTIAERELMTAASELKAGAVGEAWAPYVSALVGAGDLRKARATLVAARASETATMVTPELDLAEARLELAQKRFAQASRAAEKSMKGFESQRAAAIASGDASGTPADQVAIETDYYSAALVRGFALAEQRRWKDAIAMFDLYIQRNPTAADILVDRGNAKASLKDAAGAEKDFRAALRFVPSDKEAQAGLKRIGVAR